MLGLRYVSGHDFSRAEKYAKVIFLSAEGRRGVLAERQKNKRLRLPRGARPVNFILPESIYENFWYS
jgi:hypothetical protein